MSRSRSLTPVVIGVLLSVVGAWLGWLVVRIVRERAIPQPQRAGERTSSAPTTDISDLVPQAVFTDAEPTAIEAALRDALSAEDERAGDVAHDESFWIGNTRTLVLHRADSSYLPAEEHRQYFHSEEEALAAGYRRAANE